MGAFLAYRSRGPVSSRQKTHARGFFFLFCSIPQNQEKIVFGEWRIASILQRRKRNDKDAVRPSVGRVGQAAEDDQGRGRRPAVLDDLIPDADQV